MHVQRIYKRHLEEGDRAVGRKEWRKPEVKVIEAGSAEASKPTGTDGPQNKS